VVVETVQENTETDIEDETLLPSFGVIYEPARNMKLRFSWSRTLARPTFRELAPVATEEFIFGDQYLGNPDLTLSKIENYDARSACSGRSCETRSS
jgi:outer membrane receptor protein involved in Fe transport